MTNRHRRLRLAAAAAFGGGLFAALSAGCMQYAPDGSVVTPAPPGEGGQSRLPQLLSQLQGAGAGIELLDGSQSQVLAAQDTQTGKDNPSVTVTATVAGEQTPGPQNPQPTAVRTGTPTRTPTPARTPTPNDEDNTTPTATPTPSPAPTNTPTPTPTATSTPVPTIPSEGGGSEAGGGTPPTE